MTQAIIIGSGIGGLAAAIRLARQGLSVDVYESYDRPGGKISEKRMNGFRFDIGPSLLTLPELVLALLDEELYFDVKKLDIITRYFYEDGTILDAFSNVDQLAGEMGLKFSVDKNKVIRYLKKASDVYDLTADLFIFGSFHRLKNLLNAGTLKTLINFRKLHAFKSLHDFNRQELGEDRLVQMFDRYATYNGSNPFQTPATLCVISHLEHNLGAFIPKNGMHTIVKSLMAQALRLGVNFHFNQPVLKVNCENGKVKGIETEKGFIAAEIVVSDIDIHRFYDTLLLDRKRLTKLKDEERSSSALIFSWGMKDNFPELDIHNIFFSKSYKQEFEYLFEKKEVFNDPTIYIYISSKFRKEDAPEGCENWFVMINTPADKGQQWEEMIAGSRHSIIEKLERILGKNLSERIVCEEVLSPKDIERLTGSVNGSIYGSSSNSRYSSFNRHANFRKDIKGLYFVGGSVHPGGGIPLCLSSANIVSELIKKQLKKRK